MSKTVCAKCGGPVDMRKAKKMMDRYHLTPNDMPKPLCASCIERVFSEDFTDDEDEGENYMPIDEAAAIYLSHGCDPDYAFGYEPEELEAYLRCDYSEPEDEFDPDDPDSYATEEDYFDSLKRDDSYHFTIPFEYIVKRAKRSEDYEIGTMNMEVDVVWDDEAHTYVPSYDAPDKYLIDPNEGNGDIDEFFYEIVEPQVEELLEDEGVDTSLIYYH